jgi:hypothetical protein
VRYEDVFLNYTDPGCYGGPSFIFVDHVSSFSPVSCYLTKKSILVVLCPTSASPHLLFLSLSPSFFLEIKVLNLYKVRVTWLLIFCVCSAGDATQGLVLAGQACTTEPHPSYSDCF